MADKQGAILRAEAPASVAEQRVAAELAAVVVEQRVAVAAGAGNRRSVMFLPAC